MTTPRRARLPTSGVGGVAVRLAAGRAGYEATVADDARPGTSDPGDPTDPADPASPDDVGGHVHRSEDATTVQEIGVPIQDVWDALVDPRTYPLWLVGARRIRRVEPAWPAVGSAFHHVIGFPPAVLRDATRVLEVEPPHLLALEAGMSVLGAAAVTFQLTEVGRGTTRVAIAERAERGLLRVAWRFGGRTAMAIGLWGRNQESLRQLREGLEHGTIGPMGERPAHGGPAGGGSPTGEAPGT
jgi:uncharacterized protein YndB with AHSA1/START domain